MMQIKDSTVFPSYAYRGGEETAVFTNGITIRQHYAIQIMQGLIVRCGISDTNVDDAFKIADEMIEFERKENK